MGKKVFKPAEVFPPGEFLRDEMEARKWKREYVALNLMLDWDGLDELFAGKMELTERLATKIERITKIPARMWLSLEKTWRSGVIVGDNYEDNLASDDG